MAPDKFFQNSSLAKLSRVIAKRFAAAMQKDHPELFEQIPDTLWHRQWCSYCKSYGKGEDAILKYLSIPKYWKDPELLGGLKGMDEK